MRPSPTAHSRLQNVFAAPALTALLGTAILSGCGPAKAAPAADGTDYTACEDGRCEVAVDEPVDITLGTTDGDAVTLSITAVTGNGVEFKAAHSESNSSSGSLGGVCQAILKETSMTSTCSEEGPLPEPAPRSGELVVQLLGMDDCSAVLRLAAG